MTKRRKIQLRNQCRNLKYKPAEVREVFHLLDGSGDFPAAEGEMSVVFMNDAELAQLHGSFLADPTRTDVITFSGDPDMDFGGEVCVSVERARDFAERKGLDFATELTLYLIHGYLHLAGFDDLEPEKKRRMRRAEKKALTLLANAGKVPEFILRS